MKIVFVAPRYHTNQNPIVRGLLEKGCKVSFFTMKEDDRNTYCLTPYKIKPSFLYEIMRRIKSKSLNAVELDSWCQQNFRPNVIALFKHLKKQKPDIVITRDRNITAFWINMFSRIMGYKAILYIQGPVWRADGYPEISNLKRFIGQHLFPEVCYTPVRYTEYPYIPQKFHIVEKKRYFVPFAAELKENYVGRYFREGEALRILDVGKYRDYKDHYVLINAVRLLKDAGRAFLVTIIGQVTNRDEKKYFDDLQKYIEEIGLVEHIQLLQNVEHQNMDAYYLANHVFVLPSKKETASIAVVEALATGMPVISTDQNGTCDYIEPGTTGNIFKAQDPYSLAEKLDYYFKNRDLVAKQSEQARLTVETNYSFSAFYAEFNKMLIHEWGRDINSWSNKTCRKMEK